MRSLEDYRPIIGEESISPIKEKASDFSGKHILHINSAYQGGGVAEILSSLVPLMNSIGIDTEWRVIHATSDFFTITKKLHNALQGERINLSEINKNKYLENNKEFSTYTPIDHDYVIVHDPQPLPLIKLLTWLSQIQIFGGI